MNKKIYFMPGRRRKITQGLGVFLSSLGFEPQGRETLGSFEQLWFGEQLQLIKQDLVEDFWSKEARLIGVSYGAYLLLHALSELKEFPGKLLCISPVIGTATAQEGGIVVRPPRGDKLLQIATKGNFPIPRHLEIHTGKDDQGCASSLTSKFASFIKGAKIEVVPESGHNLGHDYIQCVVRKFLS